ncbi:MAG: rhodanese-like domain-containing protein, partial [Nitrososphaeraceae archaeon]
MKETPNSNSVEKKQQIKSTDVSTNDYELPVICDLDTIRTLIRKKTGRIVDVRKQEEYEQGHIPTAVSLPLAHLLSRDSPEGIVDILESVGVSDKLPVVVYDDTFGALAARVAWT